jgi:16S rRNA (uracil1498-N3)-methyltransferase
VALEADEVAHVRSLRLRPGAVVEVTDGLGGRWAARLSTIDRRSVIVAIGGASTGPVPPPFELWVPVGHRDRSLWLVEKAVEIGVEHIRFVEYERSRSVADAGRSSGFVDRARRRAIAALKQSGGSTLPTIDDPASLSECLDDVRSPAPARPMWMGDAAGRPIHDVAIGADLTRGLILLIGPEGGLRSGENADCVDTGFLGVGLGPRTLRFETAALVGLAVAVSAFQAADPRSRRPVSAPDAQGVR